MNVALSSIKRPIFVASITIMLLVIGWISYKNMGVDLFPESDWPVVVTTIVYGGAPPDEIENLIAKPVESELSSIGGLKTLTSNSMEGVALIVAEFNTGTDIKYAEQQIRDKIAAVRPKLPTDIKEPTYKRFGASSTPIMRFSIEADLSPNKLYDLANETIKEQLGQVPNVGEIQIVGGRRRQVQVELDRDKLNQYRISASRVANQLKNAGVNVPVGKDKKGSTETVFRAWGQFETLDQIENAVVLFSGDVSNSVTVKDLGTVRDGSEDAQTVGYLYYPYSSTELPKAGFFGKAKRPVKNPEAKARSAIFIDVYKQTGSNTVAVADAVRAKVEKLNDRMKSSDGHPRMIMMSDTSDIIRANVEDVKFTIILGIILAVLVVYMFLGSLRSTLITGIAIPTSLVGGFILMYLMGFTMNLMSLMALSLAVGLLIDDAVVIQENIYRKREHGLRPFAAAEHGTVEVQLAVLATTLVVIAVFGPIGFLPGSIGIYFRQFGFTVVFSMMISFYCAMTIAPLLNAYFAGKPGKNSNFAVQWFDRVQDRLDVWYGRLLDFSLRRPGTIIAITVGIFLISVVCLMTTPAAFQPENDNGEFTVNFELPANSSLNGTTDFTMRAFEKIRNLPQIRFMTITVGNTQSETNKSSIMVKGWPRAMRKESTTEIKQIVRTALKDFAYAKMSILDSQSSGMKPFMINLQGDNMDELIAYSEKVVAEFAKIKDLTEISTNYQKGKPEYQIALDPRRMEALGVAPLSVGGELRTTVEGAVVGYLHQDGLQYEVNLRLKENQRNLRESYHLINVPNTQDKLIPLSAISTPKDVTGPSVIMRVDKSRTIQIGANLAPGGAIGTAGAMAAEILTKTIPMPKGISYKVVGQGDFFKELMTNIMIAFALSVLFIYLVLASLYDSFITPLTILASILPALSGAFIALKISGLNSDLFSMIGMVALLGLVTKNAILLVDFALEGQRAGMTQKEAIKRAGVVRLRPILMTSFAIVGGMIPLAVGIGEAAAYRKSMGVAILGGVILSTFITLVVVPAIYESIDRLRARIERLTLSPATIAEAAELIRKDAADKMDAIELQSCVEEKKAEKAAAKTAKKIRK